MNIRTVSLAAAALCGVAGAQRESMERVRELLRARAMELTGQTVQPEVATFLEQVSGDPRRARDELLKTLPGKGATASVLIRLCALHEQLGEVDQLERRLRELAKLPGTEGEWAARKLAARTSPQDRDDVVPRQLREWLNALDREAGSSGGPLHSATEELRVLGPLAVPALIGALHEYGAHGLRNAFALLSEYDDPRIGAAWRALLGSKDPIRPAIAAEVLPSLHPNLRRSLASHALASPHANIALAGAFAVRDVEPELVTPVLERLAETGGSAVRRGLAELLATPGLGGEAGDRTLRELAFDRDEKVASRALSNWLLRHAGSPSAVTIDLLRELPADRVGKFFNWLYHEPGFNDPELLCVGFERTLDGDVIDLVPVNAWREHPSALRAMLQSTFADRGVHIVANARAVELLPEVEALIDHPDYSTRDSAFDVLADLAPERLLARADEFLEREQWRTDIVEVLADHGGAANLAVMVRAVRDELGYESVPQLRNRLLSLIVDVATAQRFDEVLNLATVPDHDVTGRRWELRVGAVNQAIARRFTADNVATALDRVFDLDPRVVETVMKRVTRRADAADTEPLAAVVSASLRRGLRRRDDADPAGLAGAGTHAIATGAIEALGSIADRRAVTALEGWLDVDELAVATAVALLRNPAADWPATARRVLQDRRLVAVVATVLADPRAAVDHEIRALAIERLVSWPESWEPVAAGFLRALPDDSRREACSALIARSAAGLEDDLVISALEVLGDERDETHVEVLAQGLQHPSEAVRWSAVEQLQRTFSKAAAPYLIDALRDDDGGVVQQARAALERINSYITERETWQQRFGIKPKDRK